MAGVVCLGVNVVGQDCFPSCHDPKVCPLMHNSNVGVCILGTEQEAEFLQGTGGQDARSLAVSRAEVYSQASQVNRRREILS